MFPKKFCTCSNFGSKHESTYNKTNFNRTWIACWKPLVKWTPEPYSLSTDMFYYLIMKDLEAVSWILVSHALQNLTSISAPQKPRCLLNFDISKFKTQSHGIWWPNSIYAIWSSNLMALNLRIGEFTQSSEMSHRLVTRDQDAWQSPTWGQTRQNITAWRGH